MINLIKKIFKINKNEFKNFSIREIKTFSGQLKTDNYDQEFTKYLSVENIFNNKNLEVNKKIFEDISKINKILQQVKKELDIDIELYLQGGAFREIILDKAQDIKDLDIIIKYNISNIFKKEDYNIDKINNVILKYINNNNLTNNPIFFNENERILHTDYYGHNILKILNGIIKISDESFNYNIDLLITEKTIEDYFKSIDFGICAVAFLFNENAQNEKKMIKDIFVSKDFFHDIKYKYITYNCNYCYNSEQTIYSFENHLPRIFKKYNDYTLKYNDNSFTKKQKSEINILLEKHNLIKSIDKYQDKKINLENKKLIKI